MMQVRRRSITCVCAALPVAVWCALLAGQWQVNNQIGQVNNRVGGELYGNNANVGSIRYAAMSQRVVLPSQARYATWKSGALPSELAMNYAAVGPLAPNGVISYIPQQSTVQAAMKMPPAQLVPNNYDFVGTAKTNDLLPPQAGFAASNTIRYSAPAPPAPPPPSKSFSTGQTPTQTVRPPAKPSTPPALKSGNYIDALSTGSINYSSLAKP